MGTRIYPILKEGVTNAQLLNISEEVANEFAILKANYDNGVIDADTYYEQVFANDEYRTLNSFDLYGWGKFKACDYQLDEDGYVLCCGEEKDASRWKLTLFYNDIECQMPLLDGIYWC